MNRRIRRSAAAAVRISLISAGGALGWLALSAGTAIADDDGKLTSLGSVTSVVESVTTPVEAIVQDVAAPLTPKPAATASTSSNQTIELPAVSDVVSSVPENVGNLNVVEVVAPATQLIDAGLSQTPIVNVVVPQGTTTAVTQPVLEVVDSTVAPVLQPVQQVVTPVVEVIEPVVRTVDPVIDVVEPVVSPVVKVVDPVVDVVEPVVSPVIDPVIDVVDPVVKPVVPVVALPEPADVIAPTDVVEPADVVEVVPTEVAAEPSVVDSDSSSDELRAAALKAPVELSVDVTTQNAPLPQAPPAVAVEEGTVATPSGARLSQGAVHELQGFPSFASVDHQQPAGPLGVSPGSANTGVIGSGSVGSGSPYATNAQFSFDFVLSSAGSPQSGYLAALPSGPTFDPGSTPD
ncbi:hypothetical protein GCM10027404_11240 [Arthrobacter tumbae]|uniref:hypothetical protein n=1 Tax=Arthrobacter tumbae TaxID=163874 RepID=UPI00195909BD|nr:hypothetical protein [Arthrobacter tumbae]MBM7782404.1 hypothetical protein [Arthrobacter tumbae]